MASKTSTDGPLANVYESRIGAPSTADEVRGYWIFALGVIFAIAGVVLFLNGQAVGNVGPWSIALAAGGLVFLMAGPIIRLPLRPIATPIVYVGTAVSAAAIVWFLIAYPAQWTPQASQLPIIGLYAVGVLLVAAGGLFVPILTDREDLEAEVSTLESELDELREALDDSEADEAELAEEIDSLQNTLSDTEADNTELGAEADQLRDDLADAKADEADLAAVIRDLRNGLSDTEADNAELEREVDQLRDEIADTEADQADLAALLTEQRASQAQFELYEDRGEQWRWRLRHRNGNIIAGSTEGYTRKHNAQNGMQAVRRDALGAPVLLIENEEDLPEPETEEQFVFPDTVESQATFELYEDEGGEFRWRLRHDNGNIIADGREGYASRDGAETAVDGIREYVGPAEYLQPDPTAIEVYRDEAEEWRWRLRHRNGNNLAGSGEGYANRGGARQAIDRLREGIGEMEIEIYEDEGGGFRWRLAGGDGKVKVDSGGYESHDGAEEAVERVREFMPDADLLDVGQAAFEIYEDETGEHRWRLRHRNGNILAGDGQGYSDRSGVFDGIESVKRNAPNAGFEEADG